MEFSYQLDVIGWRRGKASDTPPPFRWDPSAREVSFRNGSYRYVVHDSAERLGVSVFIQDREVFLEGDKSTRKGDLNQLRVQDFMNVQLTRPQRSKSGSTQGQPERHEVPSPINVRYARSDAPAVNLYKAAGLPAMPFRTDGY